MHCLRTTLVALAAAVISSGVLAQTDPKLTSTVVSELVPNEVTLSRGIDSATPFIGRAAWRVKLKNGATHVLNRALFTAEAVVVAADTDAVVPGAVAAIDAAVGNNTTDVIHVAGEGEGCKVVLGEPTKLSCNFTDGQLGVGEFSEFIIVVKTPAAGARLKLRWSFGGDEGNGGGNGCCTKVADTAYTTLIDAAANNSTVKTHVRSFMVKGVLNKVFTGINGGAATEADPWATGADLGVGYLVNTIDQTYTKSTVDEQVNPSILGSCSALNKNQCWLSLVSIPDTTWLATNPLVITLERHSSIIKNGSKLSNYVIEYSENPGVTPFAPLSSCSVTGPTSGAPCVDVCAEVALTTKPSPFVWRCTIKALDNGGYKVQ